MLLGGRCVLDVYPCLGFDRSIRSHREPEPPKGLADQPNQDLSHSQHRHIMPYGSQTFPAID